MITIYFNEAVRCASIPLTMKNPRTVGQKFATHNGVSLASVIKNWGGAKYMKSNGALTPLGKDKFTTMKADVGLPKKSSTEEYIARTKEIFSSLISVFLIK